MATTFTKTTLSSSYNDDWNDSDHYHQILFNSGRALQARELTQMQTIQHKELARLGKNLFKEGTPTLDGGAVINSKYDYVQISSANGSDFSQIPIGTIFTDGAIQAKVLEVHPQGGDFTINTLYVSYLTSGNTTSGSTPPVFGRSGANTLLGDGYELTIGPAPAAGKGTRITVTAGEYFVLGRFVSTETQSLILSPYSEVANTIVGYRVIQDVVTVNDNAALYDNSADQANNASPGADRYRIRLELAEKTDVVDTDNFVFVARVENSTIVEQVSSLDSYNIINDLMAKRTFDESGNYVINPFILDVDSADAQNLSMTISEGLAYVNGYRVEIPSAVELLVPRSISDGDQVNNDIVPVIYGNYVELDNPTTDIGDLPSLTYEEVKIYDDIAQGVADEIGTARIRSIEAGATPKLYLFDINMNAGKGFETAQYIEGGYKIRNSNVDQTSAILLGTTDNDLLFPTSRPRAKSFADITLTVARTEEITIALSAPLEIALTPLAVTGETFVDGGLWLVRNVTDDTAAFVPDTVTFGGGATTVTITSTQLVDDKTYEIFHYVKCSSAAIRTKTLTETSGWFPVSSGEVNLGVPDVASVTSVQYDDGISNLTNGTIVSERFTLDDGQRDNYYDDSKLILKPGETDPGNVYVVFKHFVRGNTTAGKFYAPSSYANVNYGDIPEHVKQDGTVVSLRNYLDFRPDKNGGTFSNICDLPRNGSSIDADITYNLPRADKLLLTQEGDLQVLMGQQSKDPQFKSTPDNSLELYQILLNANTIDGEDVQIKPIEHKHYTMADIAEIDNKLEEVKQYSEMSIAELRLYHKPALDSDGIERSIAGLSVFDAMDQSNADTENEDYCASIDPENGTIRACADEDNIRLIQETGLGANNVIKKGDNIYLSYSELEWKYQDLASRSIKVNPFGLVDNVGVIKLSPSSDEWKDSKENAVKVIQGDAKLDTKQAFLWNNWQWNWKGRNYEDRWDSKLPQGTANRGIKQRRNLSLVDGYSSAWNQQRVSGFVRRVVHRDTLRRRIRNRTADVALIPWIRSRKIYFKAQGLKPNTKFTPFFDGKDVSAWCKKETFVAWSDRTGSEIDNGNQYSYNTLTGHPDTASDLITEADGTVEGSFWLPNLRPVYEIKIKGKRRRVINNYLRFRAGIREFKLLDIDTNDWAQADSKAFAHYSAVGSMIHRWSNILSSRTQHYVSPLGSGFATFPNAYSPQELKAQLDARPATTGISIPQLSGLYGPVSEPLEIADLNNLVSEGKMSTVLSDYITVNNKQFASNVASPVFMPQNPLSQTFYVDNQFGLVLTKISLYFRTKDTNNLPISVHIRPVVDGKPSMKDIVPDSHVFLQPNDVTAIGLSPTLTTIQAAPTDFVFEEPVFLQPYQEYAIVITSSSDEYEIFSAKTLESVLGQPSKTVTTQPALGTLYLPQNGISWNKSNDHDLMMKLTRAQFSLDGGSLYLTNAPLPARLLENNPIRLRNTDKTVYVSAPCHGLAPGDTVYLQNCEDIANIVANTSLNTVAGHVITDADINGYTFELAGGDPTPNDNITGGGDKCLTSRNVIFDVADPNIETIIPNTTSVEYAAKFITGSKASGASPASRFKPNNGGGTIIDAKFIKITPDQNIEFDQPRAIYDASVTDLGMGASQLGGGVSGNTNSTYFKVDFKSSNDYVSPIVDLQRCSLGLVGECVSDGTGITDFAVAETEPSGGTEGSKHISTPITTEVPSTGFEVSTEVALPTGSALDLYYRSGASDQNITELNWIYVPPTTPVTNTGNGGVNVQANWLIGGQNGSLNDFQQVQTKMVLKGIEKSPVITSGIVTNIYAK